jgi:pimeloyl-ACP methyl ester carboxylesterase
MVRHAGSAGDVPRRLQAFVPVHRPAAAARVPAPQHPHRVVRTARSDDEDRRAGRRVACPTLVLWATGDDLPDLYGDVLGVWRPWAGDLRGRPFSSGHHMAEEAPDALAAELLAFLAGAP